MPPHPPPERPFGRAQPFCRFATFPLTGESPPFFPKQEPFCRFATFLHKARPKGCPTRGIASSGRLNCVAFVRTNAEWAKPKPLLQAERANTQGVNLMCLLFFVSEVFAVAKVKLCRCRASGTAKLRSSRSQ